MNDGIMDQIFIWVKHKSSLKNTTSLAPPGSNYRIAMRSDAQELHEHWCVILLVHFSW